MPSATLESIAFELGGDTAGVRLSGDAQRVVHNVSQDSRRVAPGDLFVWRSGIAAHLEQALAGGIGALLCADDAALPANLAVPVLTVPAARLPLALALASSAAHGHPSFALDVVAVTGTNGKTTITTIVAEALDAIYRKAMCAVIGTVGAHLGATRRPTEHTTPTADELARLLAWARQAGATAVAMEASSHALDQQRLDGVHVQVAAFSNLTQDHLDYHRTMEAYYRAKLRLFRELGPAAAVICVDDAWGKRLASEVSEPLRVSSLPGSDTPAELAVKSATFDAQGVRAVLRTPAGERVFQTELLGAHNLQNALVALGILLQLELPVDDAIAALAHVKPVRGRLEIVRTGAEQPLVVVDYAHTPDALTRVLSGLRPLTRGRLLCVFGCGGDRDRSKRAPMAKAVEELADVAVLTSDNPRTEDPQQILRDALAGWTNSAHLALDALGSAGRGLAVEVDRRAAIAAAIAAAGTEDTVLIAGKGHEDYQIIGTTKHPFDDVQEARAALAKRR